MSALKIYSLINEGAQLLAATNHIYNSLWTSTVFVGFSGHIKFNGMDPIVKFHQ